MYKYIGLETNANIYQIHSDKGVQAYIQTYTVTQQSQAYN